MGFIRLVSESLHSTVIAKRQYFFSVSVYVYPL